MGHALYEAGEAGLNESDQCVSWFVKCWGGGDKGKVHTGVCPGHPKATGEICVKDREPNVLVSFSKTSASQQSSQDTPVVQQ